MQFDINALLRREGSADGEHHSYVLCARSHSQALQCHEAQKISFSLSKLTNILSLFHIPQVYLRTWRSRQDYLTATWLVICVTSLEDLVESAAKILGTGHIQALASAVPSTGVSMHLYTLWAIKPIQSLTLWAATPSYTHTVCIDATYRGKQVLILWT